MRPDDTPKEDSDQAINIRPYNEHVNDRQDDDDFDIIHDENDNNNDNDYSDDEDEEEPDEQAGVTG